MRDDSSIYGKYRRLLVACCNADFLLLTDEEARVRSPLTDSQKAAIVNYIEPRLRRSLKSMATLAKVSLADSAWQADPSAPGYLRYRSGGTEIKVPHHLAPLAEDREKIEGLLGLGRQIKLMPRDGQSTVRMSGSVLVMSTHQLAGDLDFCERIRAASPAAIVSELRRLLSQSNQAFHVTGAVLEAPGTRQVITRSELEDSSGKAGWEHRIANGSRIYLKALARNRFGTLIPVTNMIFLPASTQSTFQYQEIHASGAAPDGLADFRKLSAYLAFLREEIDQHALAGNFTKMAKRLLSFNAVFLRHEERESVQKTLEGSAACRRAVCAEKEKALRVLRETGYDDWVVAAEKELASLKKEQRSLARREDLTRPLIEQANAAANWFDNLIRQNNFELRKKLGHACH